MFFIIITFVLNPFINIIAVRKLYMIKNKKDYQNLQ